ncbi:hypothetical protein ACI2L4_33380 [Streptomyces sparsogenes]|uniref:hypothetical protein n=1 Tax=Streptomyces sparsogenes TaxID=67365 RepID=UPI0033DD46B7
MTGSCDTLLTEHLGIEGKDVLPIVPEYVTAKEWHDLGDHAINALPKSKLPIVFGMLAQDRVRRPSSGARRRAPLGRTPPATATRSSPPRGRSPRRTSCC